MAIEKGALPGLALTGLVISVFTIPIFRSGAKTNLTLFDFVKEHTIWGKPVQFVPVEDYARELQTPQEAQYAFKSLPRFASSRPEGQ